jgi:hypothetical protein
MGVYGLITGFSAPSGLNLVKMALAICTPETISSSGSLKRSFFVLWLTSSTLSTFKGMNPCSPPVNAAFAGVPAAEASTFLPAAAPPRK